MSNSIHQILKLLRQKQNVDNNECQAFQKALRLIFDEIWETKINETSKQSFMEKFEDLLVDYSSTINNLGFQYYEKIESILIKGDNEENHRNNNTNSNLNKYVPHSLNSKTNESQRDQKKHLNSTSSHNLHNSKLSAVLFECEICHKKFSSLSSLNGHKGGAHKAYYMNRGHQYPSHQENNKSTHSYTSEDESENEDILKCEICGDIFTSSRGLKEHSLLHSGERKFKCPYCHKGFILEHRWAAHITNVELKNPYKCYKCTKKFRTKGDLKWHQKVDHGSEAKSNGDLKKCDKCNTSLIESELAKHKQWVHGDGAAKNLYSGSEDKGNTDSNSEHDSNQNNDALSAQDVHQHNPSKLFCICRQPYDGAHDLKRCNDCQEWYHLSCIGVSEDEFEESKFKCPACNMEMDENLDTDYFPCTRCSYTTKSSKDYCKHVSSLHKDLEQELIKEKWITICPHCKNSHFSYDRHSCPTKTKKWWKSKSSSRGSDEETSSDDIHHDESNSIPRPFKCKYENCHQDFTKKCYLFEHVRRVHRGKPYKCNKCDERFTYIKDLEEHQLQHRFNNSHIKDISMDQNTMSPSPDDFNCIVKRFECDYCGKSYLERKGLFYHLRIDHDVKPYKCKKCDQRFNFQRELKLHLIEHQLNGKNFDLKI